MNEIKKPVIILIAEDDEDDYLLAKEAFQEAYPQAELHWVKDGEELMDYLWRRNSYKNSDTAPRPAMILLDLNMPKKDGREALKEIKSCPGFRAIPIVALTTSNAESDVQYTYDMGVSSFLRKPIGFAQFTDAIKVFSRYWFEIVRLPLHG